MFPVPVKAPSQLKPKTFEGTEVDEASAKDEYSVFDCCDDDEGSFCSSAYQSALKMSSYSALLRQSPLQGENLQRNDPGTAFLGGGNNSIVNFD